MDAVFRALAIYLFLLVIFRLVGRRTLGQLTSFDFVLLLIIGEATQQALLGEDFSITNAILIIVTLLGIDVALSLLKQRSQRASKLIDGVPMIIVQNGQPLRDRMEKARVDVQDVMQEARKLWGLERIEEVKYAILEMTGDITIIPREDRR